MEGQLPPPPPVTPDLGPGPSDDLGIALKIVSFCFPIVGAILYFVKKDKQPVAAKQACTFALIGFGLGIVINIFYAIIIGFNS